MGKITTTIQLVGGIVAVILISIMIVMNQGQQEKNESRLQEAVSNIDGIVEKAILHCNDGGVIGCDKIMLDWYYECQKEELMVVASCHDGRIENYLKVNQISP